MTSRDPILVLGGSGFIGSHVVERLASMRTPVIVASRSGRWRWGPVPTGVECVSLDLTRASSETRLLELTERVSGIINLTGTLHRPGLKPRDFRALHVEGTSRVFGAVRASSSNHSIRVVHISTTGVLGPTGVEPLDEAAAPRAQTPYETSKLEGERIALSRSWEGVEVVIVRPGLVYGPRDMHLLAWYRSIQRGSFRLIGGGRALWQPIYVEDVANGIVKALRQPGCVGVALHLVGDEVVSVRELSMKIARLLESSVRGPTLPYGLAFTTGAFLELICLPLGLEPPLSRSRVRTLTQNRLYASARTKTLLGFAPEHRLDSGLGETVAWYRQRRYLQ